MASLVLGIAGAAALGPAGLAWGGALGMSGAQIGFTVGSMIGNMLTKLPDVQGPRLGDLKVQSSTYGKSIPIYYGTSRGAGEVMWSSDLIETENEESSGGLGKGGPSQSVSTYTYSVNCAVAVCAGEITGIRRIWANGNLIYDQSSGNVGPTGQSGNIRVYTGSETQVADALIEAYLGAGNVPAHRGLAYVVFENLQLEKYGNRIPNFSFEVVANGDVATVDNIKLTESTVIHSIPHPFIDGIYLSTSADNGTSNPMVLHITDAIAQTDRVIDIADIPASNTGGFMTYVDFGTNPDGTPFLINEIWISTNAQNFGYSDDVAIAFDANTLTFKRKITPLAAPVFTNFGANIFYDKNYGKVLFAQGSSAIADGYNYLDPISLLWDGVKNTDIGLDWFDGKGIAGKNSVALSASTNYVAFFVIGEYAHSQATSNSTRTIAYDTLRERYAWYDRNDASFAIFRTVDDDINWEMNEYISDVPAPANSGGLNYFAAADKYIFSNTDTIFELNADTFQIERSWQQFAPGVGYIYQSMEIPAMPEYLVAYVNDPSVGLALVPLTDRLAPNTVTLSSIVTDICERVGLAAGDIDVTGLTDQVEGYTIAQQMTARAAIDGLQAAFYFDAVESD